MKKRTICTHLHTNNVLISLYEVDLRSIIFVKIKIKHCHVIFVSHFIQISPVATIYRRDILIFKLLISWFHLYIMESFWICTKILRK